MDNDSKRKKFIADLVRQLDITNREDWQRRNIALIKLKALITDPEQPLKLTSREITQLRVALLQQLEDLRSTIVKEACNIIAKMAELMPEEFESSAPMFLKTLLSRLHVSVKVIADSADGCIRSLITHLPCKVLFPQIAHGTRELKNTVLRQRCHEYVLLMLQIVPKDKLEPHCDTLEEILSRALGDASKEIRSIARDSLHLFSTHWPERARRLVSTLDTTIRKVLINDPTFQYLLIDDSDLMVNITTKTPSAVATATLDSISTPSSTTTQPSPTPNPTFDNEHKDSSLVTHSSTSSDSGRTERRGRSLSSASHSRTQSFSPHRERTVVLSLSREHSPSPSRSSSPSHTRDSSLSPPDSPRSVHSVTFSETKFSTIKQDRRKSVGPLNSSLLKPTDLPPGNLSSSSPSLSPLPSSSGASSRCSLPKSQSGNTLKSSPSSAPKTTPKSTSFRDRASRTISAHPGSGSRSNRNIASGSSSGRDKSGGSSSLIITTKLKSTVSNKDNVKNRSTKSVNNSSNLNTKEKILKKTLSTTTARPVSRGAGDRETTVNSPIVTSGTSMDVQQLSSTTSVSSSFHQTTLVSLVPLSPVDKSFSSSSSSSSSVTLPSLPFATSTMTTASSTLPSPVMSSSVLSSMATSTLSPWSHSSWTSSLLRPLPVEESTEVLILKLRRLLERSRRSVLRDSSSLSSSTTSTSEEQER